MVELNEIKSVVAKHQPKLTVTDEGDFILLSGPFVVSDLDGSYDPYNVEIKVFPGFPQSQPHVFEVGRRIPKHADWHINISDGSCCVCVWEDFLCSPDCSFETFLTKIVDDYFFGQTHFEKKGEWPFGERSHGKLGILESYAEILRVEVDAKIITGYLRILSINALKGHHYCPCGSGKKLKNCHRDRVENLRSKIDPPMAKQMLKKMRT